MENLYEIFLDWTCRPFLCSCWCFNF